MRELRHADDGIEEVGSARLRRHLTAGQDRIAVAVPLDGTGFDESTAVGFVLGSVGASHPAGQRYLAHAVLGAADNPSVLARLVIAADAELGGLKALDGPAEAEIGQVGAVELEGAKHELEHQAALICSCQPMSSAARF